jgi:hypothetical protein
MKDKEKIRQRYLRDTLPRRLGGLAATLGRISSSARNSSDPAIVADLLDEARHFIEWTAGETEPEIASELVHIQTMLSLWQGAWDEVRNSRKQRILLSVQAKQWSDKALDFPGLS